MARTSLMRAVRKIAGEHKAASALGVSVEEARAPSASGRLSRREFVLRTGAVGAGLAVAGRAALGSPAFAPSRRLVYPATHPYDFVYPATTFPDFVYPATTFPDSG